MNLLDGVNKSERGGIRSAHLAIRVRLPCIQSPEPRSERRKKRRASAPLPLSEPVPRVPRRSGVMVQYEEPLPRGKSSATKAVLKGLVGDGLLPPNTDPSRPVWIAPMPEEREPQSPSGYVMSLARLHERGFGIPAGRFVRALCHHYKVERHNFAPNSIS